MLIFISIFLFWPGLAEAATEGIPLTWVFFQTLNFTLFALVLVYLIRKKLPSFLQKKKQDFLEYQKKAQEMEKQNQSIYLSLQKEWKVLQMQEQSISQDVEKALYNLEEELKKQEKKEQETLKVQTLQELKRQRLKELRDLKNRILEQVMIQAKQRLKEIKEPEQKKLDCLNKFPRSV